MPTPDDDLVPDRRMALYYAERASIYERVYHQPERQADLRQLEADLPAHFAGRHVLELACGTGWWTPHGARDAAVAPPVHRERPVVHVAHADDDERARAEHLGFFDRRGLRGQRLHPVLGFYLCFCFSARA